MRAPCPYHEMKVHIAMLCKTFGFTAKALTDCQDLPLFPNTELGFAEKAAVVATFTELAKQIGMNTTGADGENLIGGHSGRVSGARWLASTGVELFVIQLHARWESEVIKHYVKEAPLLALTKTILGKNRDHRPQATDLTHALAAVEETVSKLRRDYGDLGRLLGTQLEAEQHLKVELARLEKHFNSVSGKVGDIADKISQKPAPKNIRNTRSHVLHRALLCNIGVSPAGWRTACGWHFACTGHFTLEDSDAPCRGTFCDRCWPGYSDQCEVGD
eukprot:NODE_14960_length_1076_cov_1.982086.p3 GENE.NODE_14960_length_1076_cov_1.982086~~NODE_14960_length_1076_cov_1.982086.p3  ORF type:complete len:319 (-),score=96.23 NODE_14960_length_1076_cov_1.982086:118-939(-)